MSDNTWTFAAKKETELPGCGQLDISTLRTFKTKRVDNVSLSRPCASVVAASPMAVPAPPVTTS